MMSEKISTIACICNEIHRITQPKLPDIIRPPRDVIFLLFAVRLCAQHEMGPGPVIAV